MLGVPNVSKFDFYWQSVGIQMFDFFLDKN
jgi:hypothetical protein